MEKLDHLSWSQMGMLARCGEQYRRRYGLGERLPPGIALLAGKAAHSAQEQNLLSKMNDGHLLETEQVLQVASDSFDNMVEDEYVIDGLYEDMSVADATALGKDEAVAFSSIHATCAAPTIEPTGIEVRIEIPEGAMLPVPFVGVIDLIDGFEQRKIRDTKTTRKSPPKGMADESDQLTAYHLMFQARYKEPPAALGLDFLVQTTKAKKRSHVYLETTRTKADLQVFINRAQVTVEAIEKEVFLPAKQDDWVCSPRWCGYTRTCRYYRGQPRPTT